MARYPIVKVSIHPKTWDWLKHQGVDDYSEYIGELIQGIHELGVTAGDFLETIKKHAEIRKAAREQQEKTNEQ